MEVNLRNFMYLCWDSEMENKDEDTNGMERGIDGEE
jgi:hypothetical protein